MSVCKTSNGGTTWPIKKNLGTGGYGYTSCRDIAVAPSNPSIVYAGGDEDSYIKIFRSADSGNSWSDATGNLSSLHSANDRIYAIWITPNDPNTLLVGSTEGAFKTTDAGANWSPTLLNHSTSAFAYFQATDTLYAATESQGVYSTEDRGTSWQQLNDGLGCRRTLCADLDKENGLLYIGTDGGSVWRLNVGFPGLLRIDLNDDGLVDLTDFIIFASRWKDTCSEPGFCQGCDFDTNGSVNAVDLFYLTDNWLLCQVDLNLDGAVNFTDLAIFAHSWRQMCSEPDWCLDCDFDHSGSVDYADLLKFVNLWLW
jgi:hypothetical protein